jgi:hypothetical protein
MLQSGEVSPQIIRPIPKARPKKTEGKVWKKQDPDRCSREKRKLEIKTLKG